MYSWELEEFIKQRNYYVGGDDLVFVINIKEHPQINSVKYDAFNNMYHLTTNDNYNLDFNAMPLKEAQEKGLVKKRTLVKNR